MRVVPVVLNTTADLLLIPTCKSSFALVHVMSKLLGSPVRLLEPITINNHAICFCRPLPCQLRRAQLALSLSKFRKCLNGLAAANSIVVFYYAGHGLVVKGHHYMLCPDYEDYLQHDIDTACKVAGFSLNNALADITAAAQKAKVIAFLDTCRSTNRTRGGAPAAETQGSNLDVPLQGGTELLTCYACGHLKEANDGDDGGNGVYTKHLLQVSTAVCKASFDAGFKGGMHVGNQWLQLVLGHACHKLHMYACAMLVRISSFTTITTSR